MGTLAGAAPAEVPTAPGTAIEMLSSGTTGPPKRVLISERQLDESLLTSGMTRRERLLSKAVPLRRARWCTSALAVTRTRGPR